MGAAQCTGPRCRRCTRCRRVPRAVKRDLKPYKPPDGGTVRDEIVTLRLVLKTAILHCWLTHSPDLSPPYKTQGKVVHRPQFSPDEYEKLFESAR
jgi:hypothetical protein